MGGPGFDPGRDLIYQPRPLRREPLQFSLLPI
jgi:hypothetical protein